MTQPYQTQFQHAAEFTTAVTFMAAGGKRASTTDRRAGRIIERIASHAARLSNVVQVTRYSSRWARRTAPERMQPMGGAEREPAVEIAPVSPAGLRRLEPGQERPAP